MIPGELRHRDVAVGAHIPVSPGAVPRFLRRFEEVYSRLGKTETILAAAESSAPTRQGLRDKEPARNAGVKARPSPRCCFGATPLVGELPRSNGQTTAWPSALARA